MYGFICRSLTTIWNTVKIQGMLFMFHSYHFGFHINNYIYKSLLLHTGLMREDPTTSTWCNTCTITDTYALKNHYKFQNYTNEAKKVFEEKREIFNSDTVEQIKSDKLWMCKLSDSKTIVYSTFNYGFRYPISPILEDYSMFDSTFLYIEYKHPDMKEAIELNIPRSFFVVHNALFTPCFVLNRLERQDKSYVFDHKYIVTVIDKDYKKIELKFNNYITLLESSYKYHMLL
jgi:hypothetical protein